MLSYEDAHGEHDPAIRRGRPCSWSPGSLRRCATSLCLGHGLGVILGVSDALFCGDLDLLFVLLASYLGRQGRRGDEDVVVARKCRASVSIQNVLIKGLSIFAFNAVCLVVNLAFKYLISCRWGAICLCFVLQHEVNSHKY
jgi:hypothetical protein